MVFGVPPHAGMVDSGPAPRRRLDAHESATEPKRLSVPRTRVRIGHLGGGVCEIPFDGPDADGLEVDEAGGAGHDDHV